MLADCLSRAIRFPDYWPADVGRFWLQARRSLEGNNWDAAAVMARSALQLSARLNGAAGSNLKQEINDLGEKGLLPPIMVEWSHEVRELGNDSAHPAAGSAGASAADAKDIVEFLTTMLTFLYQIPHQIIKLLNTGSEKRHKQNERELSAALAKLQLH